MSPPTHFIISSDRTSALSLLGIRSDWRVLQVLPRRPLRRSHRRLDLSMNANHHRYIGSSDNTATTIEKLHARDHYNHRYGLEANPRRLRGHTPRASKCLCETRVSSNDIYATGMFVVWSSDAKSLGNKSQNFRNLHFSSIRS